MVTWVTYDHDPNYGVYWIGHFLDLIVREGQILTTKLCLGLLNTHLDETQNKKTFAGESWSELWSNKLQILCNCT